MHLLVRTLALTALGGALAVILDAPAASAQQPAATGNTPAPAPTTAPAPAPTTAPAPAPTTAPAPAPARRAYPYGAYPYGRYPYPYPYQYAYGQRPPRQQKGPRYLPYHDGQPIPRGYYLDESMYRGPAVAGAIMIGGPYIFGLAIAAGGYNFADQSGWLALPVLGPVITAAARHNTCPPKSADPYGNCSDDAAARSMLVLDALTQTAGAVLLIYGVSSHHKRLVREDTSFIVVTPTRVGSGYGLGVEGRL